MNDSTAPHQPHQRQHYQRRYGLPFFNWLRSLGIVRGDERWLAGACGALAARTGLDPLIIRGIAIVVAVLGGPIFFFYALAWALLPDTSGRIHAEQVVRSNWTPAATGISILLGLSLIPFTQGIWWQGAPLAWGMPGWLEITLRVGWTIALVVGFIALVIYVAKRVPADAWRARDAGAPTPASNADAEFVPAASSAPSTHETSAASPSGSPSSELPAAPRPTSAWDQFTESEAWKTSVKGWTEHRRYHLGAGFISIMVGLAAVVGAIVSAIFAQRGWSETAFIVGGASALATIGLGAIVAGIRGKQAGALNFFALVLIAVLVWTSFFPKGTEFTPFGAPTMAYSQSQETPGFAIIAGAPRIDLRDAGNPLIDGGTIVDVWIGAGDVELLLPPNTTITVETSMLAGGTNFDGFDSGQPDRRGVFLHDFREVASSTTTKDHLHVRVWGFFGQATINPVPSR